MLQSLINVVDPDELRWVARSAAVAFVIAAALGYLVSGSLVAAAVIAVLAYGWRYEHVRNELW